MGNTKKKKTDEETVETVVEETAKSSNDKADKEATKEAEKEAKKEAKIQDKIEKATSKQTKEEKKAEEKAVKQAIKKALKIEGESVIEPVDVSETKIVTTEFLNVRRSPDASTSQNVITIIRKGTPVNVTAHFDGVWSKIDFEGIDAYVMSKFIN